MWKFILWWHFLHDIKAQNAKHNLNYYWNINHSKENFVSIWIKIVTYLNCSLKWLEVLNINRDDNKFWTLKENSTVWWKLPQTIVSQYNIGRLIFCIKGSRGSPLIFYKCTDISPHLYRWWSLYGSHILHSLYNKRGRRIWRGFWWLWARWDQSAIGILMKPSAPVYSVPCPVNIFTCMQFPTPDLWC